MATMEIKETNWDQFCKRFEEAHRNTLITLDVVNHDGTTAPVGRQSPLRSFRFQKTDQCSDVIQVELGETAGEMVQHQIVEPIHLRVREEPGAAKVLLIDAEQGSVEMRFSSGRLGAILKDLDMENGGA
jgi:hypothetical protein